MQGDSYRKCCEILEVPLDAAMGEIKRSYLYLKELYSADSIASMALEDEFSDSDKKKILAEIEQAFQTLMALMRQERELPDSGGNEPCDDEAVAEIVSEVELFDGPALKRVREKMGVSLDDIAMATRIQLQYLVGLEDENFEVLPPEVYTRGFVTSYAEFLSLDVQKVAADYMVRYREWKSGHHKGARTIASLFARFKHR
jgi:hypothetical protein